MRQILLIGISCIAVTLFIALALIASQKPIKKLVGESLDFPDQIVGAIEAPSETFVAADGEALPYREFLSSNDDAPLLVFLHGSGWHSLGYTQLAQSIAQSGAADVILPDLRGHGFSPNRRGDLDYIGQFEDDIAALISAKRKPGQRILLGGHSSGGGLAIRFAGGKHSSMIDGAVLIAPFLKYNAPTMRSKAGGWAHTLTRRIIGLSILNTAGIKLLNGLTVIQFAYPERVLKGQLGHTATQAYSYRLNTSFAPRSDYLGDIAKLPTFLLLAGSDDEAFKAEQFEPTLSQVTNKGSYAVLSGSGHLDILNSSNAANLIVRFLKTNHSPENQ